MMRKDLRLALELGAHVGVPLPLTVIGEQLHTAGIGMGFEHSDFGPGMYVKSVSKTTNRYIQSYFFRFKVLSAMSNTVEDRIAPLGFVDKVVMVPQILDVPQTVRVPVGDSGSGN